MSLARSMATFSNPITRRYLAGSPLAVFSDVLPSSLLPGQLLMRVAYAGVNRLDLLQRAGRYPPPPGVTDILGVEVSGVVVSRRPLLAETQASDAVIHVGSPVMALLDGGGYATHVIVDERLCLPVPKSLSLLQAASIPETWITAYQLCRTAGLFLGTQHTQPDASFCAKSVLIHAGASGVGTALVQLVKAIGVKTIIATCGSPEKTDFLYQLGASVVLNRHETSEQLASAIKLATDNNGVNKIFDCVGASRFALHCDVAATDAKWILFGTLGGVKVPTLHLGSLLARRIRLEATTLRSRSQDYKYQLLQDFARDVLPQLTSNDFKLFVKEYPLQQAETALQTLESNQTCGKLVIRMEDN